MKAEVISLKEGFVDKYGVKHALKSPPHVTIQMPIRLESRHVHELIELLEKTCTYMQHGRLELKGIGAFTPRTIFIEVVKNSWITSIHNTVKSALSTLEFLNVEITENFHPHLTLMTRDLSPNMFIMAMEDLKDLRIDQTIPVHKLTLYKHNSKTWEAHKVFALV